MSTHSPTPAEIAAIRARRAPHTREPWRVVSNAKRSIAIGTIATTVARVVDHAPQAEGEHHSNAERILACVNGCAGLSNPAAIPDLTDGAAHVLAHARAYTQDAAMVDALNVLARALNRIGVEITH